MTMMMFTKKTLLALFAALSCAGVLAVGALASTSGASPGASAGGTGSSPAGTITPQPAIHKTGVATWFGPGFYGQKTACGQTLMPGVVGVANRTLPCGTLVKVSYKGHTLTVPVLDRGPYSHIRRRLGSDRRSRRSAWGRRNRPHRHARRRQRPQHPYARRAAAVARGSGDRRRRSNSSGRLTVLRRACPAARSRG